jgi:hypothetical protein
MRGVLGGGGEILFTILAGMNVWIKLIISIQKFRFNATQYCKQDLVPLPPKYTTHIV